MQTNKSDVLFPFIPSFNDSAMMQESPNYFKISPLRGFNGYTYIFTTTNISPLCSFQSLSKRH